MAEKSKQSAVKYAERLALTKEKLDEEKRNFAVEDAKHDVEAYLLQQKKEISQARQKLNAALAGIPLDVEECINRESELEELEAGLERLKAFKEKMF